MHLFIQIPCLNEENTLASVIKEIPTSIKGITKISIQIIDDGSTDNTIAVAKANGADFIIKNIGNKGLGTSFKTGINHAVKNGADILVNTDGDNQYPSKFIPDLIKPILEKKADIVVGDRQTASIKHFSFVKKIFQSLGTALTRLLSGEKNVADAVSGFRAYSKDALLDLNVTNQFSYVLDTTIQASNKRIKTSSIFITTNSPTRPSRLFSNIWQHIRKSGIGLLRTFAFYKPLRVFFSIGAIFLLTGLFPLLRFLYDYWISGDGSGKIQSLIIGSMLMTVSFNFFALGIIGDLMSRNRILVEDILKNQKNNGN